MLRECWELRAEKGGDVTGCEQEVCGEPEGLRVNAVCYRAPPVSVPLSSTPQPQLHHISLILGRFVCSRIPNSLSQFLLALRVSHLRLFSTIVVCIAASTIAANAEPGIRDHAQTNRLSSWLPVRVQRFLISGTGVLCCSELH